MKDPVKLIKQDHRTIKALFRKFDKATRRSERQQIAQEMIEELSRHAAMEEQLLYPMLRARDPRIEPLVLDALEEHHAAKLTLLELDKMDADDERFAAKVHVVRDEIEAHIELEETRLLPRLEKLFDAQERADMAQAIVLLKESAPTHPHPLAPDEPPGNVLASMFAKLTDTGKDLVRRLTESDKTAGHRRATSRARAGARAAMSRRAGEQGGRGAAAH